MPSRSRSASANRGFEAKLRLTADKLRNNMAAAEYRHVVPGLIFLKYISDTFEEHLKTPPAQNKATAVQRLTAGMVAALESKDFLSEYFGRSTRAAMSRHFKVLSARLPFALAALAAGILAALPSCESVRALRPFTTDGCSSFPDGTPSKPDIWHSACVVHDVAYWRGGTFGERRAADQKLRDDVAARGYRRTAKWMYAGVRLGGGPWWPTRFRWGYGWPWGRGYRPLSDAEKAQAAALRPGAPPPGSSSFPSGGGELTSRVTRRKVVQDFSPPTAVSSLPTD